VGAILASWAFNLQAYGVPVLGPVPSGLPRLGLPHVPWSLGLVERLLPTAIAMMVVILAQSAATSRAYAARNGERFDENVDLVGLALANLGAAFSGTFVVNGSPTKTQMVASAGGRSQLAQLVTCAVVLLVLLVLTGPLAYMPRAVLSAVVFLIGIELIDLGAMRRILAVRPVEFAVAVVTAAVVVLVGVEQGILAAMVLSLLAHVRRGYRPKNAILVESKGEPRPEPVKTKGELRPGLVVYRFNHGMYYANAAQLSEEVSALAQGAQPKPQWFCFDMAAVDDVDFTAAQTLAALLGALQHEGIRPVLAEVADEVRAELDRYGITKLVGVGAIYRQVGDVLRAYGAGVASRPGPQPGAAALVAGAARPLAAGPRHGAPNHA
jgi:MFS superfamily sulfate permease-like transporter